MNTVLCEFIAGSDAQGCVVVLVSKHENITVNLTRSNGSSVKMLPCQGLNFTHVFGFDIESDGSIGTVPVAGEITVKDEYDPNCPSGGLKTPSFSKLQLRRSDEALG